MSLISTAVSSAWGKRDPDYPVEGVPRTYYNGRCLQLGSNNILGFQYLSETYPTVHDWTTNEPRYDRAYDAEDYTECSSTPVAGHSIPYDQRYFVTEHIFELISSSF